jgi:hypothetical protein
MSKGLILNYLADIKYFNSSTRRITDKSAYGNHGIAENALVLDTDWMGQTNKAISFNGENDHISIPHDDSLNLVDGFSASIRIRPTDVLGSPQGIFSKGNYALKEYDDEYIWQVIGPDAGWGNQLATGTNPMGLCTYNGKLYCACHGSNDVYVFDGTAWTNSGSVGSNPYGLCVYNGKLYCSCNSGDVYIFDGTTWTNSGSVGSGPYGLCVYNGNLYCVCHDSNDVYVFDGTTWTSSGSVGVGPYGLCTYNGKLYCSCGLVSGDVYVFDGTTWTNSGSVGSYPYGLCVYNDKLYCGCNSSNDVYVFDGTTWTNSGSVGSGPYGLCVYNGNLYCTCGFSSAVYVFDGTTWTSSGSVGIGPSGLCIYNGKLYCSDFILSSVYEFGTGHAIRISHTTGWDLIHVDYTATSMSITLNDDVVNKVTANHALALDNNTLALRIGASYGSSQSGIAGGNDEHLKGLFGEIRTYNRILSASEQTLIKESYRI